MYVQFLICFSFSGGGRLSRSVPNVTVMPPKRGLRVGGKRRVGGKPPKIHKRQKGKTQEMNSMICSLH